MDGLAKLKVCLRSSLMNMPRKCQFHSVHYGERWFFISAPKYHGGDYGES
jgi:hypothetical protein